MTQHIRAFVFEGEISVRTIERDGLPWFVAADICSALGLRNVAQAVDGLQEDEKGISIADTLRGQQELIVVSESGLYALIFKSRRPEAVRFRRWVTGEVLPALRQHGHYTVPGTMEVLRSKPFDEWTCEEKRVAVGIINMTRHTLNVASAAWMMERLGVPMPPRHLLPAWRQQEFGTLPAGQH